MAAPKSVAVLDAKVLGIEYTPPEVPAEVIYSEGFESGTGGWMPVSDSDYDFDYSVGAASISTSTEKAASGTHSLRIDYAEPVKYGLVQREITGLVPGHSYTVRAKVYAPTQGDSLYPPAGLVFVGEGPGVGDDPSAAALTYTYEVDEWATTEDWALQFTATSSSIWVSVGLDAGEDLTTSTHVFYDDITLTRDAYAPDTLPDLPLELIDAEVTLDDARAPYAEARLTVHTPAQTYLEQVDPRDGLRVQLDAELSWAEPTGLLPQTRTFDLLLHEREIDHEAGTLTLTLESDEALLIDGGNATSAVDTGAEAHQASLRAIVDYVLDKHGAALEAGADDADFTITSNATNLIRNPTLGADASDWQGSTAHGTFTRQTSGGVGGGAFARLTLTTATIGDAYAITSASGANLVSAGKTYHLSAYVRTNAARKMRLRYVWIDGSGAVIGAVAYGAAVSVSANTWTRLGVSAVAPANAAHLSLGGTPGFDVAWPVGAQVDVDHVCLVEGADTGYFDGATTDAYYSYAWTGTANLSTSTRTRLDSRDPDALKQAPGVTDWDYLDGLVRTAGLRLFCDEQRAWRLVDPATYRVEGETRVAAGTNATRGADSISLQATRPDGSPVWYSGVVVKYAWIDENGVQQTAYDAAGTSQKVYRIELNRPYPGPGLAQARLNQATGRGRVQDLEALADLKATPGMALVSTMPATPIQLGTVSAVTWFWSAEGDKHDLMAIRSRGLTDTPANAWYFAEGAWNAATGSWAAATGTN